MKVRDLVLVKWDDAFAFTDVGWLTWKQVNKEPLSRVESVGWIVRIDKKVLALAGSLSEEHLDRVLMIPRRNIRSMKKLK